MKLEGIPGSVVPPQEETVGVMSLHFEGRERDGSEELPGTEVAVAVQVVKPGRVGLRLPSHSHVGLVSAE